VKAEQFYSESLLGLYWRSSKCGHYKESDRFSNLVESNWSIRQQK